MLKYCKVTSYKNVAGACCFTDCLHGLAHAAIVHDSIVSFDTFIVIHLFFPEGDYRYFKRPSYFICQIIKTNM